MSKPLLEHPALAPNDWRRCRQRLQAPTNLLDLIRLKRVSASHDGGVELSVDRQAIERPLQLFAGAAQAAP